MDERAVAGQGELAHERILLAAEELFAAHGFDATPTSRIAERAGVPKGLIHYYFKRKADLLEALVQRLPAGVVSCPDVIVPGDLAASLERLVRALDRSLESSYVLSHLLWREADTHPAVREALRRRFDELVAAVEEVLATASGRPPAQVRGVARLLAAAIGHRHAMARHVESDDGIGAELRGMDDELAFVVATLDRTRGDG